MMRTVAPIPRRKDRWSRKLARTVTDRDGRKIRTFRDARAYILDLPEHRQHYEAWQSAARLLMESDDAGAVTAQLERALFLELQLKLS